MKETQITGSQSSPSQVFAQAARQPIVLTPVLVERIWGADSLLPWHPGGTAERPIGEIWLTSEDCVVERGAAAGHTLRELTEHAPEALGDGRGEGFPLLLKLLFPREKLSVQVHPNDAEAQALGMPRGKTECWYALSAEPGAEVAVGFRKPLSPEEVGNAIAEQTLESKLRMLPVQAKDMIFVDAGTVHAIGPGMVVLETQQYSDTTYRLWDYGRPRELHVEAGTAVARNSTAAGLVAPEPKDGFTRLVSSAYFQVDRFDLHAGASVALGGVAQLQIVIPLAEGCAVKDEQSEAVPLPRGQATILPANSGPYTLRANDAPAEVVRILQPS